MGREFDDIFDSVLSGGKAAKPAGPFDDIFDSVIPPKRTVSDAAKDTLVSAGKGILGLPGMVTGLADIAPALITGEKPFDAATDYIGENTGFQPSKWSKALDESYSPAHQQEQKEIARAWETPDTSTWSPEDVQAREDIAKATGSFAETYNDPNTSKFDVLKAGLDVAKEGLANPGYLAKRTADMVGEYVERPGYTANQIVESLPSMLVGGVTSRGMMTAGKLAGVAEGAVEGAVAKTGAGFLERKLGEKTAAAVAGGAGEGMVQTGQAMAQSEGEDARRNAIAALGSGVIDAVIGAGAGRVAQGVGLETTETLMAKGFNKSITDAVEQEISTGRRVLNKAGKVAGGSVSEGILQELPQSAQEQVFQNYADGKPFVGRC
jgi:hypothetical protein